MPDTQRNVSIFDEYAEEYVIAACMHDHQCAEITCSILEPDDFGTHETKMVFDAIWNIVDIGHGRADFVAVHEWVSSRMTIKNPGVYLNALFDMCPLLVFGEVTRWCESIKRYSAERSFSGDITTLRDSTIAVEDRASQVSTRLASLAISSSSSMTATDSIAQYHAEIEAGNTGVVTTGFDILDELLTIRPGNVVIIAAAPKVGKTTFAMQVAAHNAKAKRVLYITLEMSKVEIVTRYLIMITGFSQEMIMEPASLASSLAPRLTAAVNTVSDLSIDICDEAPMTIGSITALVKKLPNLGLIVVDYVGLVSPTSTKENREQQVSGISRGLKTLAASTGIPVLALSQLSRSHKHENRPPELYDLRDSGAVEQDANSVIMISGSSSKQVAAVERALANHEISQETASNRLSQRRIYVRAQRMGKTGWVDATWDSNRACFVNVRYPD